MDGAALKTWRAERGWTLKEAARYFGTTKTTFHRWEAGTNGVTIPRWAIIFTHLLSEKRIAQKVQEFLYHPL